MTDQVQDQAVQEEVAEEAAPKTPIQVTVIIAMETRVFEGLPAVAKRKARAYLRGQGLSIRNADSNLTDEAGNQVISFSDPSPKMVAKAAEAQAKADQAQEEAEVVPVAQESWE